MKTAKGGRKHRSAVSFCCDSSFAAPRGGRDANPPADYDVNPISTRAPRTGRDPRCSTAPSPPCDFNPRAPCGARLGRAVICAYRMISILAPRAGRDSSRWRPAPAGHISILAPRAGRDLGRRALPPASVYFNPRAPCGARPEIIKQAGKEIIISILAPRAGRDSLASRLIGAAPLFQSARPARGATFAPPVPSSFSRFQSSRPVRGATVYADPRIHGLQISIRAPRAGRDVSDP
mgnify:CR=1 FL=1